MNTKEILKLLKDEVGYFGGLSFTVEVGKVIIKKKAPRINFTQPFCDAINELTLEHNLSFCVHNDQIFVYERAK